MCKNERYGRAKFVRGIGRKLLLPLKGVFKTGERLIEDVGDVVNLVIRGGETDALRKVAVGNVLSGAADFDQRTRHARGNPPSKNETKH